MSELISIIVLNFNGKKFIKKCISSLAKQTFQDFEILFVDNASSDGSIKLVREIQRQLNLINKLKIIVNPSNLGVGRGYNVGSKYAKGKYLLLLNIDTWLDEKCLENLAKNVETEEKIGIWQSKILNKDGSLRSIGNPCDIYISATGTKENFFYANGACLLIPKQIYEKVGGLDEEFFAYCDDLDLGWRVRLLGCDITCVQNAVCFHVGSFVLGWFNPQKFFLVERNRIKAFLKNYSFINILKRFIPMLLLIFLKGVYFTLTERKAGYISMSFSTFLWNLKTLKNTLIKRKYVQLSRKVGDKLIEKKMIQYSTEIHRFKELLVGHFQLKQ